MSMSKKEFIVQLVKIALGMIAFAYFAHRIEAVIALLR